MFKKLKDKLAEEVKSSPQRIQQFAQAAQAAVNSASSSISDITNNDLFSIGENETKPYRLPKSPESQGDSFHTVPLKTSLLQNNMDSMESTSDYTDNQRLRKLSNSSFASDMSFKLPSYESPAMYHLQSDVDVSASEAEERTLAPTGGAISLEHITKEQIYTAYKRTQERYGKYRSRYADLARHYKVLERENAKARSVLVETQDKALRRISELREQCSLEQSAKAHLESALRVELDEKNMKIDAMTTKIKLLQESSSDLNKNTTDENELTTNESESQLIDFLDNNKMQTTDNNVTSEITVLNVKLGKLEQLVNKYKDSLKTFKDRNYQLTTELQIVTNNLESKVKENDELKCVAKQLIEAQQQIQNLKETNEDLQNKIHACDFNTVKEIATLDSDLKQANEEILQLNSRIEMYIKREEENAISLAENKLSIHKELDSKEMEIKSLKDSLTASNKENQSLNIIIIDYKQKVSQLKTEINKLNSENTELNTVKNTIIQMETKINDFKQKCETQESINNKTMEEMKCLELQAKQETAEKLAIIDRNDYLENRNKQICEENTKKNNIIAKLEKELLEFNEKENNTEELGAIKLERNNLLDELNIWKNKYNTLELEIQEERIELVKLQSEIEKLLRNHEIIQAKNISMNNAVLKLKSENLKFQSIKSACDHITNAIKEIQVHLKEMRQHFISTFNESQSLLNNFAQEILCYVDKEIYITLNKSCNELSNQNIKYNQEIKELEENVTNINNKNSELQTQLLDINESYFKTIDGIKKLEIENGELSRQNQFLQNEKLNVKALEENVKIISDENILLRAKLNDITGNLQQLEVKLNETQIYHESLKDENKILHEKSEKLKQEKEALYEKVLLSDQKCTEYENKIESLEDSREDKEILSSKIFMLDDSLRETKSELDSIKIKYNDLKIQLNESNSIGSKQSIENKVIKSQLELMSNEPNVSDNSDELNIDQNIIIPKRDYNKLREDNKWLLSEIEGLQTHLQKVSKDNSILNDKLREIIANSESININDMSHVQPASIELNNLITELQEEKQKFANLLKDNSVLAEKNLELQDCIQSHNLNIESMSKNVENTSCKELEIIELQEKYDSIVELKMQLETKLAELELLGRSEGNTVQQLMEKNDKMKLINEKLERRLDEALVSLRHFRALEESTELEYLRNILYEYLTGSGTHSETLAKVLSAVVKFDDKQTQLVLQKEKERQGLLRQLGLL